MPRSYDEIISLEVGSGYRNLGDLWVNHKRKKKSGGEYLLLPLIILLEFGVCQGRASAFFFSKQNKRLGKDFQGNIHHMKSEGVDWPLGSR